MQQDSQKVNDVFAVAEPQADTLFNSVVKTSLKTIFFLFLLLVLSVSYFFMRFPFHAMNLYMDFSMPKTALVYCERATNVLTKQKHGDALAKTLLNGVELSDMLLLDTSNNKYALKLIKFTQAYAAHPDFDQINSRLDAFYLPKITSSVGGISLYSALNLFSYKNFVYSRNQYAKSLTGKADTMLFNNEVRDIASITNNELAQLSVFDVAVFFNQAAISCELMLNKVMFLIDDYLSAAKSKSGVEQLYLLKAANNVYQSLKSTHTQSIQQINDSFAVDGQSLTDYFNEKLTSFR